MAGCRGGSAIGREAVAWTVAPQDDTAREPKTPLQPAKPHRTERQTGRAREALQRHIHQASRRPPAHPFHEDSRTRAQSRVRAAPFRHAPDAPCFARENTAAATNFRTEHQGGQGSRAMNPLAAAPSSGKGALRRRHQAHATRQSGLPRFLDQEAQRRIARRSGRLRRQGRRSIARARSIAGSWGEDDSGRRRGGSGGSRVGTMLEALDRLGRLGGTCARARVVRSVGLGGRHTWTEATHTVRLLEEPALASSGCGDGGERGTPNIWPSVGAAPGD